MNRDRNPKLSIIVPVYNVDEYLSECLDSIISQTYQDYEIILINDGSTDSSWEICQKYSKLDDRIVLVNKENGGLSSARNFGLDIARGEIITFVDSDDVILSQNTFLQIHQTFNTYPTVDIVQYEVIFNFGVESSYSRDYPSKIYVNKAEILSAYLNEEIHCSCCDKFFRREIFKDIRFPLNQISEDVAIIPLIIEKCRSIATTHIYGYGYRYREGSISHSVLPYDKICSILKSYFDYWTYAFSIYPIRLKAIKMYSSQMWDYVSLVRTNYPTRLSEFMRLPYFYRINLSDWLSIIFSKKCSNRERVISSAICVFGIKTTLILQKLLSKNKSPKD